MRDLIVVPTYNERENITPLIDEIFSFVPGAHVLVIDDSSPDGTAGVVRELQTRYPHLGLLERPAKSGLGSAYVEAFARIAADPDIATATTIDADFSHPPRYLPSLLEASKDADVVIGSRYVPGSAIAGWELWRRALSRFGNRYARAVTRVPVHDLTAGFVCFRREVLQKIDLDRIDSAGYAYTIESKCLAHWAGARIREVPITFEERRVGESKMDGGVVLEGLLAPWRVRRKRGGSGGRSETCRA